MKPWGIWTNIWTTRIWPTCPAYASYTARVPAVSYTHLIYSIAETAKANNLKPYDYFEHLLTEIPKHLDDTDRSFLDDLLPWSPGLPANCRKPDKSEVK